MRPDWIAVDWGTTSLRAFAMSGDEVLDEATSDQGMGGLHPDAFEDALLAIVEPWLTDSPMVVVACGMVGAQQGWVEAPYSAVPAAPLAAPAIPAPTKDPRLSVFIIPGLRQDDPADVMRGEETQIAGYLATNPDFDGVLCLPGTHTKWAHISAGEVVSFRTFMTGELFAALTGSTVLKHSVGSGLDLHAFDAALNDTLSRPESLAARLFGIRAGALLADLTPDAARGRLSGLLIGAELAAAKPYWLGQNVALIGAPKLSAIYQRALSQIGLEPIVADVRATTIAGLSAAKAQKEAPDS